MNETAAAQPPGLNTFMGRVMEWITGKDARLAQLETEAASLAAIQAQLAKAEERLGLANKAIEIKDKAIDDLTKQVAALTEAVTQTEADVERRANVMAGQRLATIGVKPIKEELNKDAHSQGSLIEQFNAEKDPEARAQIYQRIRSEVWQLN